MMYSNFRAEASLSWRTAGVVGRIHSRIVGALMSPQELYRAGRLTDAIKALSAELRDNPTDIRRRTFLFELLCFAGEYDRADKQLEVLGQG